MPNNPQPSDFGNPWYPFKRIIAANTFKGAELIPYKIVHFLMDLPDAFGYEPPDNNDYPRCRLKKYLWYDGPNSLNQAMPTAQQVKSMLYDPDEPDINSDELKTKHPQGYRIFAQRMVNQSILTAKTMLKIYPGRVLDTNDFRSIIGLQAEIWCNTNLITNTRTTAYDRCFDIEQCLREALAGVDISGVGTIRFSRQDSSYNGSEVLYTDSALCGRMVYFSTAWSEGGGEKVKTF